MMDSHLEVFSGLIFSSFYTGTVKYLIEVNTQYLTIPSEGIKCRSVRIVEVTFLRGPMSAAVEQHLVMIRNLKKKRSQRNFKNSKKKKEKLATAIIKKRKS